MKAIKQISSLLICFTTTLTFLTTNTFAQNPETAGLASASFDGYEHVNGNELIKKMITTKREFNKNLNLGNVASANHPVPQYILNRSKPTVISFDGLDYLIQHNCILAIKGLDLSDEALMLMSEKLSFLDQVQYSYTEKINLAYKDKNDNSQSIWMLDKWYLLTLKILSTTVNDFATLTKKHDRASLTKNIVKMPVPNIDAIGTPFISPSMMNLAK